MYLLTTWARGCLGATNGTSEYVRRTAVTIYHPVGTCKMGAESDPTTVVNARGQVKGLNNLRVLDASIMPTIIRSGIKRSKARLG